MSDDQLESNLLAELRALDIARSRFQIENPGTPIEHEDPDVRRMVEALAFSAVRTRHATLRNLQATWRRLLSTYFKFMLQPLPAMAMVQAQVTARMSESAALPRGTTLQLKTLDGTIGSFKTLAELNVIPMTLSRCETLLRPQGFRVVLTFTSQYPRGEDIGVLRLYIHYLDNYLAALRVQHQLEHHLQRCIAVYNAAVDDELSGPECEVSFGAHFDAPHEADTTNPLERARTFFHFPEQDLFVNIRVPPSPRTWKRLSLCFDLNEDWPRDPPLYRENFRPFAVPIVNMHRSFAQPIECDGTKDSHPILYIEDDDSFALHQTYGVYRTTPDGMEPLAAAALGDLRPTYEVEEGGAYEGSPGYSLVVRMPEAFANPEQLLIDASWYQPGFAQHAIGPLKVALLDRNVTGLDWQSVGPVRAALECPLREDPERLLYLLSLKMKPVLDKEELVELLSMLGSVAVGAYRELPERLRDLSIEVVPDGTLRGAGIRHIYHGMMKKPAKEEEPLVARFVKQLGIILDAWDYEARVEIVPQYGGGPLPTSVRRKNETSLVDSSRWPSRGPSSEPPSDPEEQPL